MGALSAVWPPARGREERAMAYDLVIKNGWVVDGSGSPRYRADVGVTNGRIEAIGRIRESAREVVDAEGQRGLAGLRRRPHPHGRPGVLGSARHLLVLARRHQRGDGQLRLHPGPLRQARPPPRHAQPRARRGHLGRRDGSGHRVDVDDVRRVPRRRREAAQGHQLLRLHRPLRAAHLCHGRARLRPGGQRGRSPRDGAASCATRSAPAPSASPPRARRATRRRTAGRWRAASPAGTRCAGSWASWAR